MNALIVLAWIVGIALVITGVVAGIRLYRRYTQSRLISCPETGKPEGVQLDAAHGLKESLRGHHEMRLRSCTRWPERQDCDQACLSQITEAPDGCSVRSILDEWYAGKVCVLCGRQFGAQINWYDHQPAFLDKERHVRRWEEIDAPALLDALESCEPVCWDCAMVGKVYDEHPELITERPDRRYG
jgi:hypothetical protein